MKKRLLLIFLFLCSSFAFLIGQNKINYSYDTGGNRTNKKVIPISTRSTETEPSVFTEQFAEQIIKIYPNPTKGLIKIEISDFKEDNRVSLNLYNMMGQTVLKTKMTMNTIDLDISSSPNGTYILQINIDGKDTVWKIIKE